MIRYLILTLIFWILTAPWLFEASSAERTFKGYPAWAVYCLALSIVYAGFVAWMIPRRWRQDKSPEEPEA